MPPPFLELAIAPQYPRSLPVAGGRHTRSFGPDVEVALPWACDLGLPRFGLLVGEVEDGAAGGHHAGEDAGSATEEDESASRSVRMVRSTKRQAKCAGTGALKDALTSATACWTRHLWSRMVSVDRRLLRVGA